MKTFEYIHISSETPLCISTASYLENTRWVKTDLKTLYNCSRSLRLIWFVNWKEIYHYDYERGFEAFCSYLGDFYIDGSNYEREQFNLTNPTIYIYHTDENMEIMKKLLEK